VGPGEILDSEEDNDYDCLDGWLQSPNWFYLTIDTPGDLVMTLMADDDIDYMVRLRYFQLLLFLVFLFCI